MTRDLDETLTELGPAYRAVVARLVASDRAGEPPAGRSPGCGCGPWRRAAGFLAAASLLVCAGFALVRSSASRPAAPAPAEYRLAQICDDTAVREMIRTQNPDGSWKNDFLTKRNAAALRSCSDAAARIAYKKARRNLRVRGLL